KATAVGSALAADFELLIKRPFLGGGPNGPAVPAFIAQDAWRQVLGPRLPMANRSPITRLIRLLRVWNWCRAHLCRCSGGEVGTRQHQASQRDRQYHGSRILIRGEVRSVSWLHL